MGKTHVGSQRDGCIAFGRKRPEKIASNGGMRQSSRVDSNGRLLFAAGLRKRYSIFHQSIRGAREVDGDRE